MTDTNTTAIPELPLPIRWAVSGLIRHSMVGLGAALLAGHILPSQTASDQFVNWAVNGALILGGLGWSFLNAKASKATTPSTSVKV